VADSIVQVHKYVVVQVPPQTVVQNLELVVVQVVVLKTLLAVHSLDFLYAVQNQ
jgi:hypothetical protein